MEEIIPTATVVFREVIETALILGIVMAATRGMPSRIKIAFVGLGVGLLGSMCIAFFTEAISNAAEGMGQELFNAAIMFTAVACLSWTVIWMKSHGRQLAKNLKQVGQDVVSGDRSVYVLVGVIALATFREGAEIVLFTYAMASSGAFNVSAIIAGGMVGATGGAIIGTMFYFGLLKAAQKHLFAITGWMLIFLTAGMAAHGASFLIQADILPALIPNMWDTSWLVSGHGFFGQLLSVLIGYNPRPSGMELIFYAGVLLLLGVAYLLVGKQTQSSARKTDQVPTPAE